MPKLKPTEQEQRDRIVRACISSGQELQGVDDNKLAEILHVTPKTVRNKKNRPGTFTLDELQTLARVLKLTAFQDASIIAGRELTAKEIKDFILL